MIEQYSRFWWVLALRGVLAVLFALAAFLWPALTLTTLVLFFGAYALVDGIFTLLSLAHDRGRGWWAPLLEGLTGIAVGILVFLWPAISELALIYMIAAWALVTGLFEIVAAVRLREEIEGEWLLALTGAASILLGVLLFIAPEAGALGLVWAIGGYALVFGVLMIALAFRLRGLQQHFQTRSPA